MLKILQVAPVAERGGLEVILLNILAALDRSRFTPHAVLLEDGPFVEEVQRTGAETFVVPTGRVRNIAAGARAVVRLVSLIREKDIAVVHSHNAKAHIYGGLAASLAGIPSVYHLHGVPKPALTRDGLVSALSVAVPARRTIACSHYVAGEFRRAWHGRRDVAVIHNGLVSGKPTTDVERGSVRQEFGISDDVPLVLMVARLQRWKGVHVFLDSAAQVLHARPEVRFIVAGGALYGLEQDYARGLHGQAQRLGLADRVVFAGHRADTWPFYAAADVVVHSSVEPDPFPTVILEAMEIGRASCRERVFRTV